VGTGDVFWRYSILLRNAMVTLAIQRADLRAHCSTDWTEMYRMNNHVWLYDNLDSLKDARWWEVFPLRAVSVLVSGPASPRESHPHSHGRETVYMRLLWTVFQTETAATSAHQPLPRTWLRATGTTREGLSVKYYSLSLSLSHSRSGGRVTAPIVSRKLIMRRGSVESM